MSEKSGENGKKINRYGISTQRGKILLTRNSKKSLWGLPLINGDANYRNNFCSEEFGEILVEAYFIRPTLKLGENTKWVEHNELRRKNTLDVSYCIVRALKADRHFRPPEY